jgi:hypothetical protein
LVAETQNGGVKGVGKRVANAGATVRDTWLIGEHPNWPNEFSPPAEFWTIEVIGPGK